MKTNIADLKNHFTNGRFHSLVPNKDYELLAIRAVHNEETQYIKFGQ